MAEPGPDCSSLLDEDLSSFVFSYLADSQVGREGGGGGSAVRLPSAGCNWGGGSRQTPPPTFLGHLGKGPVPAPPPPEDPRGSRLLH